LRDVKKGRSILGQTKVTIDVEEWKIIEDYFNKYKAQLWRDKMIRSRTGLLRYWIRECAAKPYKKHE
jgi:hypothetical protein